MSIYPLRLPCPWCRETYARDAVAEQIRTMTQGARYGCVTCGVRFTLDLATLEADIFAQATRARLKAASND